MTKITCLHIRNVDVEIFLFYRIIVVSISYVEFLTFAFGLVADRGDVVTLEAGVGSDSALQVRLELTGLGKVTLLMYGLEDSLQVGTTLRIWSGHCLPRHRDDRVPVYGIDLAEPTARQKEGRLVAQTSTETG